MATSHTYATRVGVFRTQAAAETTVEHLRADGYPDDHIGLVAQTSDVPVTDSRQGPTVWAGLGAVAGAAAAAVVVPGVVPVLAAGAAGAVLLDALVGAAVWEARGRITGAEAAGERYVVTVDAGREYDRPAEVFAGRGRAAPAV